MANESLKRWLLSLKHEDITRNLLEENFAYHYDRKTQKMISPKYRWDDEFSLKKGEYFNKEDVPKTNAGLFIFNKHIVEGLLEDVLGYWNETITDKVLSKKIEKTICTALYEDKITADQFAEYENRLQWMLAIHSMVSCSLTPGTITPNSKVVALRDKRVKENKEALDNGDAVTALKIEKELLDVAKKELKNDPGMDLYNSGARCSFNNNYKSIAVMKGPVMDPLTGKYHIVEHGFVEGIDKKDIPIFGTTVTQGAYPKAVGTRVGGYSVKRFYAAFQNIVLDKKGSDCGSKMTRLTEITPATKDDSLYRYIVEGNKIIRLTPDNIGKYMGKTVHMRSPLYCTSGHFCNVCFGDKPYMVGIKNVGLTAAKIGSNFINLSMKSFHDTSMHLYEINPDDILL